MRYVQVTVPEDKGQIVLKKLMEKRKELGIRPSGVTKVHSSNSFIISFRVLDEMIVQTLAILQNDCNVGREFGMIDVIPLDVVKPSLPPKETGKFFSSGRLTGEEILRTVDGGNKLTFDIVILLVAASIIAGVGLASNSSVVVVASMLVSPLMGPILAFTLGPIAKDWKMFWNGLVNEICMVAIAVYIGVLLSFLFLPFGEAMGFSTDEMSSRGNPWNLLLGILVAVPSGAGVAISISSGAVSSLVGVAISASLLPPCVNTGLSIMYGSLAPPLFHHTTFPDVFIEGLVSFVLVVLNIFCLWIVGIFLFKLKSIRSVSGASTKYNWDELVDDALHRKSGRTIARPFDEFFNFEDPLGNILNRQGVENDPSGQSMRHNLATNTTDLTYEEYSFDSE